MEVVETPLPESLELNWKRLEDVLMPSSGLVPPEETQEAVLTCLWTVRITGGSRSRRRPWSRWRVSQQTLCQQGKCPKLQYLFM